MSGHSAPDEYCRVMLEQRPTNLLACLHCDLLQREVPLSGGGAAKCSRCGTILYRHNRHSIDHALALALACAQVLILANLFPLVTLDIRGDRLSASVPQAAWTLYQHDMPELAGLVFITTILAPGVEVAAMIYLLLGLRLKRGRARFAPIFRLIEIIRGWGMIDVLMLGILVAVVKLSSLATVVPGIALWAFASLLVLLPVLNAIFNPRDVWRWFDDRYSCMP
jgi:paraquat-inducible protein A